MLRDAGAEIRYGESVGAGDSVSFVLEYYVPSRLVPGEMAFTSEVVLPEAVPLGEGLPFDIDRFVVLPSGEALLEFSTVLNRNYQIQYSADGVAWRAAHGVIRAAGNRVQWIDQGPPRTHTHPADDPEGQRFYRVVELPGG